jgi:hypothetical protein
MLKLFFLFTFNFHYLQQNHKETELKWNKKYFPLLVFIIFTTVNKKKSIFNGTYVTSTIHVLVI